VSARSSRTVVAVLVALLLVLGMKRLLFQRRRPSDSEDRVVEHRPSLRRGTGDRARVPRFATSTEGRERGAGPPESAHDGSPTASGGSEPGRAGAAAPHNHPVTVNFGDGMGRGARTLQAYDPHVFDALVDTAQERLLSFGGGILECARDYKTRVNIHNWRLATNVELRGEIKDSTLRIVGAQFPLEKQYGTGDDQFQECYRTAVAALPLPCPGCRDGEVAFSWSLRKTFWGDQDPYVKENVGRPSM
jgi:hypothetical protein